MANSFITKGGIIVMRKPSSRDVVLEPTPPKEPEPGKELPVETGDDANPDPKPEELLPEPEDDPKPNLKPESKRSDESEPAFPPKVTPLFSPVRKPYSEICAEYGITASAKELSRAAGFDRGNYNNARKDRRPVTPAQMITACFLSSVSVQDAFDAFHYCTDTQELNSYDLCAESLVFFLLEKGKHDYRELIWKTITAYSDAGIFELPKIFRRNRKWIEMKARIDSGLTYDDLLDEIDPMR